MFKMSLILVLAVLLLHGMCCCSTGHGGGELRADSYGSTAVTLPTPFTTAAYTGDPSTIASFYLCDMPVESLLEGDIARGQVVHIELLWLPRPGRTPLDSSATNLSIRHVIFVDGEFAVYGGAGFANLSGDVGDNRVSLHIEGASMSLLEKSDGFKDLLEPAVLTGGLTAVHDPQLARRIGMAVSQEVTNRLGRPRYVRAE